MQTDAERGAHLALLAAQFCQVVCQAHTVWQQCAMGLTAMPCQCCELELVASVQG